MAMTTFIFFACLVLATSHMTQPLRKKRSDDLSPWTTVVTQLSAQLNSLVARLDGLEAKQSTVDQVVNRLSSVESRLESLEDTVSGVVTRLDGWDAKLAPLQQHVAFRAQLTTTPLPPLNAPLKFDHTVLNHGNAYDASLGVFEAPVDGVYFFSVQIFTRVREKTHLHIRVNGDSVTRLATEPSAEISGLTSVVVELHRGDKVWVEVASGPDFFHGGYTFFNGVLLYSA